MIDTEQFKDIQKQLDSAFKMLESTAKEIPERVNALKDLKAEDAELIAASMDRFRAAMKDVDNATKNMKV